MGRAGVSQILLFELRGRLRFWFLMLSLAFALSWLLRVALFDFLLDECVLAVAQYLLDVESVTLGIALRKDVFVLAIDRFLFLYFIIQSDKLG